MLVASCLRITSETKSTNRILEIVLIVPYRVRSVAKWTVSNLFIIPSTVIFILSLAYPCHVRQFLPCTCGVPSIAAVVVATKSNFDGSIVR